MPTLAADAICIRHWDFSETSQTVSLFTRPAGLLRGLAKGARRPGGNFSGGIDLLSRGQVVAIVKPGRELATLTAWTLAGTWRSLRSDLSANRAGYYIADLVQRLLAPADPHPALFDATVACLDALDGGLDAGAATLVFQTSIVGEVGLRPRYGPLPSGAATLLFSPAAGGLVEGGANDAWKVRRTTLDLLAGLADRPAVEALTHAAMADADSVGRANRLLAAYLRHVLGTEPMPMRQCFPQI